MCLSCNSLPVAMILQSSSNKVILFTDNQSDCTVFLSEAVSSSPTVIATSEGCLSLSVCVAFTGPALSGQEEGVNNFFTLPMNYFSPANLNILGTSKPPCGRSTDAHLLPVTSHTIVPLRWRNREQTADIVLGMWPTTVPASFFAAITKRLLGFSLRAGKTVLPLCLVSKSLWKCDGRRRSCQTRRTPL